MSNPDQSPSGQAAPSLPVAHATGSESLSLPVDATLNSRKQNNPSKRRSFNYRKLFWKWHLYAGLLSGPLLMLIAITGALLVFSPEIDTWLRPDYCTIAVPASGERVTEQAMLETVQRAFPEERVRSYEQPDRPDQPYRFLLSSRSRRGDRSQRGTHEAWVNPYSGEIVGDRIWDREKSFGRFMEQLHRRLLKGELGSSIVELITGWAIVLTLTGLFMWWPKTSKALWNGLTLSFKGSAYKVNWRMHNVIGAWTGIFVLLMCLSGMVFSTYSGQIYWKVQQATGTSRYAGNDSLQSTPIPGQERIPIDRVLETVRQDIPDGVPLSIQIPRGEEDCLLIQTKYEQRPVWANRHLLQNRSWTFDQFSGELLGTTGWEDLHPMRQFWIFSLTVHYGSIFGMPTKWIALVSCLAVPVLSISGYLIWWWKRQGKKQAANRKSTNAAAPAIDQSASISKTLVVSLIVVGILFPTIGVSYIALVLWEGLLSGIRRIRQPRRASPASR